LLLEALDSLLEALDSLLEALDSLLEALDSLLEALDSLMSFNETLTQTLPQIGFGTYRITDQSVIEKALDIGYRSIDTAALYKNEQLVANAVRKFHETSTEKIFITTKISKVAIFTGKIAECFYERLAIFDYIDVLLLHTPSRNCYEDWILLSNLYEKHRDRVGFIGLSNYDVRHLEELKDCPVKPYCNQIELTAFYTRFELVNYCKLNGIVIVSHSTMTRGEKFDNSVLKTMAKKYNISVAKLLLLWAKYYNYIIIPRSKDHNHILENICLDVEISYNDIEELNKLNEDFFMTKVC